MTRLTNVDLIHLIILAFRRFIASCSIRTTSLPITLVQLKPFVHDTSVATLKLVCLQGKLNVKARK